MSLQRYEHGSSVNLGSEVVAALAAELGLEPLDLGWPARWAFAWMRTDGSEDLAWFGGQLPLFGDPCAIHEAKGWVALGNGYYAGELEAAATRKVYESTIRRELARHPGEDLRLEDPGIEEFRRLLGIEA